MSEPDHPKPVPARPAGPQAPGKPPPARAMSGERAPPTPEADASEATLEVEGRTWTVRVLGRSGRASGASAPLLQLGFWAAESEEDPVLEVLVVGTSLAGLSESQLEVALTRAAPPADPARERPFFAEAGQVRRR